MRTFRQFRGLSVWPPPTDGMTVRASGAATTRNRVVAASIVRRRPIRIYEATPSPRQYRTTVALGQRRSQRPTGMRSVPPLFTRAHTVERANLRVAHRLQQLTERAVPYYCVLDTPYETF